MAIRRRYPQIYASTAKLAVDASSIVVDDQDFSAALMGMTPASHRTVASNARPLPAEVIPLLQPQLDSILTRQRCIFPLSAITNSMRAQKRGLPRTDGLIPLRPRILLHAPPGYGQSHLAAAVLHALEEFPVYSLGLPALVADPQTQTPEVCRCFAHGSIKIDRVVVAGELRPCGHGGEALRAIDTLLATC